MSNKTENQTEQDSDFPMEYSQEEAHLSKIATIMLYIIYGGAIALAIIAFIIHHSK